MSVLIGGILLVVSGFLLGAMFGIYVMLPEKRQVDEPKDFDPEHEQ